MAASKQGKAFTFKKKTLPVEDFFTDDESDDDFMPSKRPFPPSARKFNDAAVQQRQPEKTQQKVSKSKSDNDKKRTVGTNDGLVDNPFVTAADNHNEASSSSSNSNSKTQVSCKSESAPKKDERAEDVDDNSDKDEIEVVFLEDEQENCDVTPVDINCNATKSNGKDAWKNLMGQMQKSQETLRSAPKKGSKLSTKRAVYGKVDQIQSPVKKNARVGGSHTAATVTALKEFKNGSTLDTKTVTSTHSTQLEDVSGCSIPVTLMEDSKRIPTTIAPIFLPAAERKAVQKSSLVTSDTSHLLNTIIDSDLQTQNNNMPEDPAQFMGNVVILNQHQIDKDPYEGNKTKVCPFYKKLPGVPFCVDAFNYGLIPGMEVYFLSHFHSDHYIGLSKKFCKTVICSYPTGNLVRMKLYVEEKCIRKLHMNKPYVICESEVTLVDANHCPGSVMFVFRFKSGSVMVHTGDFRYTPNMLTYPCLSGLIVDSVYLDTTYCSPQYDFPTQNESIASVVSHVRKHLEYRPQTLILCGSYLIGKERVYFTLAEAIGSKVYGTYDKRKIINALDNKKFTSLLSPDEKTQIHVVPMFSISAKEYLAKYPQYTNIIGIKPSGWQFSSCGSGLSVKTHYNGSVTLLGVPYSEHSSFSELREFVTNLKPKRVQPTVNVGNPKKREEMMRHIQTWLSV